MPLTRSAATRQGFTAANAYTKVAERHISDSSERVTVTWHEWRRKADVRKASEPGVDPMTTFSRSFTFAQIAAVKGADGVALAPNFPRGCGIPRLDRIATLLLKAEKGPENTKGEYEDATVADEETD